MTFQCNLQGNESSPTLDEIKTIKKEIDDQFEKFNFVFDNQEITNQTSFYKALNKEININLKAVNANFIKFKNL